MEADLPPLLTCTPRRVFVTVKMSSFLAAAPQKEQRGGVIIGAGMSALIANQCLKEGLYSREERQVVEGLFFSLSLVKRKQEQRFNTVFTHSCFCLLHLSRVLV